ncbi:MAG: hypothetical protein ACM3X7_05080 [Solirubrobacterales bacterium]
MKKIVFLPAWYKEVLRKKHKILYRNTAVVLGLINILLITLFVKNMSDINTLESKRKSLSASENEKIKAQAENKSSELTTLNYFISDFSGIDCENIKFENKKISFETNIGDNNSYSKIIKQIEDKKKYKLISVFKTEVENKGYKLKISIEVVI